MVLFDPMHNVQGHPYSNDDDYVQSQPNADQLYSSNCNQLLSPTNVMGPRENAWHTKREEFESPYLPERSTYEVDCEHT